MPSVLPVANIRFMLIFIFDTLAGYLKKGCIEKVFWHMSHSGHFQINDSSQGHEKSESHLFFGHRCTIIMFMFTWNLYSSEMTDI